MNISRWVDRPLIGNVKVANLFNAISPEFDAHRMLIEGREEIDDATTHRKLSSFLY